MNADIKRFEDVIAGIIFLGVPHDGSRLILMGKLLSRGAYWLGSSTEILESLKPGARELRELNNNFLLGYRGGFKVVSFWERKMTKKWNIPLLQVSRSRPILEKTNAQSNSIIMFKAVDENSAIIPGEIAIGLDVDHLGMNKFESEQDNGYELVRGELERMVGGVLEGCCTRSKIPDIYLEAANGESRISLEELPLPWIRPMVDSSSELYFFPQ